MALSGPEEELTWSAFGHVDEDCDHGGDDGGGLTGIGPFDSPLVDDDVVHVDEGAAHEEELRDGQREDIDPFGLPQVVVEPQEQAQHHVRDPEDDCHFHLETIGEGHLVE